MDELSQAIAVLREAEKRLQQLLRSVATSGNYDTLARITEWARAVGEMTVRGQPPARSNLATINSRPSHRAAKAYPQFFRSNSDLVKVAWSKKERAEYKHKAPYRIIPALAKAILRRTETGRRFTTDQVFPLVNPDDRSETPSYQGYVALAWLKHLGLVKQSGRSGYSVPDRGQLEKAVSTAWDQLPELS
ncbi:MAG: hypothetical protein KDA32_06950 [Phycisphaerales bacterium]|nr:hypothetical protein [Phycisphaerales bacterium]